MKDTQPAQENPYAQKKYIYIYIDNKFDTC